MKYSVSRYAATVDKQKQKQIDLGTGHALHVQWNRKDIVFLATIYRWFLKHSRAEVLFPYTIAMHFFIVYLVLPYTAHA
jgi:hypothetical protein